MNFLICRPLGVHRDRAGRRPRADAGAGQPPRVDGAQDGQGRPGELSLVETTAVLTSDWLVGSCGGCVRTGAWRASLTRASAWGCRPTPTVASPTSRTGTVTRSSSGTTTTSTSSTRYILEMETKVHMKIRNQREGLLLILLRMDQYGPNTFAARPGATPSL